ncbi:MAG: hypothetical protein J2O49_08250 [Sciscionella sp.]|nr:hypothetical protein [Sciscionella sp.]
MTIVRSLSGWIVFAIVGAFAAEGWAALAALVVSVISLWLGFRESRTAATVVIEIATTVFFAGLTVLLFAAPQLHPGVWVSVASQLWLAGTVGVTLAIGKPFTLAIAKREAPPEFANTPRFYAFNVTITRAWLISFLVAAILLAGLAIAGVTNAWLTIPIIVLAIAVPLAYTRRLVGELRVTR